MKRSCILAWVMAALPLGDAAVPADAPLVLDLWPGVAVGDHGQIGPERVRAVARSGLVYRVRGHSR